MMKKNKKMKGQLGYMQNESQVNNTSDTTKKVIYDGIADEGYELKKHNTLRL